MAFLVQTSFRLRGTKFRQLKPILFKRRRSRFFVGACAGLALITGFQASLPQADASEAISELEPRPDFVRVRLIKDEPSVTLDGTHLEFQKQPAEVSTFKANTKSSVRITRDHVGSKSVWIITEGTDTRMIAGPGLFVSGQDIHLNGNLVPNRLVIWPSKSVPSAAAPATADPHPRMNVLASVQIEEYVAGVLPAEMSLKWPIEALKAQAVAIRTYAIFRKQNRNLKSSFDVESSYLDQVFRANHARALGGDSAQLKEVIEATRGEVLLNPRGKVGAAYFHADCGGVIESAETIWGSASADGAGREVNGHKLSHKPVVDEACALRVASSWTLKMNKADILRRLRAYSHTQNELTKKDAHLEQISVDSTSPGQHALEVTVALNGNHRFVMPAEGLRAALGYSRLRSTRFDIHETKTSIEFKGRGFGHGVGLCQTGARGWANKGWNYEKILSHYYPVFHINRELIQGSQLAHAGDDAETSTLSRQKL